MDFIEDEAFISELEIFGVESVPPDCLLKCESPDLFRIRIARVPIGSCK